MNLIRIEEKDNEVNAILDVSISNKIAEFERQLKTITEQEAELKSAILEEMEKYGILKLETDNLVISYYSPSDRETFDKDTFREDHPDMYDDYIKITPVKSSIRIKVK